MNFKSCSRCGCFFVSDNNVCCNCEAKDKLDISNVNNYINGITDGGVSLEDISLNTGISIKNLNRFVDNKNIKIDL